MYPGLFSEKEIRHVVSELTPALKPDKRVERTLHVHNSFLAQVREKVHVVISVASDMSAHSLGQLLRDHSLLSTDVYVDNYRRLSADAVGSVARHYLARQVQRTRLAQKMLHVGAQDYQMGSLMQQASPAAVSVAADEVLGPSEILVFSQLMVEMHQVAARHYHFVYSSGKNENLYDSKSWVRNECYLRIIIEGLFVFLYRIKNHLEKFSRTLRTFATFETILNFSRIFIKLLEHSDAIVFNSIIESNCIVRFQTILLICFFVCLSVILIKIDIKFA